jgi:hypothetical protein
MATTSQAPLSKAHTINLKIRADGDIDVTGPLKAMNKTDTARFVVLDAQGNPATNVVSVLLEFKSIAVKDLKGEDVPLELMPFGVASLGNPATAFTVVNACAGVMLVTIVTTDNRIHHCAWDPVASVQGPVYCTQPVKCP